MLELLLLLGWCFLSCVHGSEINIHVRPAGEPRTCTALLTRSETGQSVNAPAGVRTPPTRVLSSRRVLTTFMKVYWTTWEPEWVEKRATRKCFNAHHNNLVTCITQSQVKTLVGCKRCLMLLFFCAQIFAAHLDLLIIQTHLCTSAYF